jgi:hypothetical protein
MNINKMIFRAAGFALMCLLAMCQGPDVAGNSSQTGSGGVTVASVKGIVSGMTSPDASVSIYVTDYVVNSNRNLFADTVLADKTGKFAFDSINDSYYNLLVIDSVGKMGFIQNIPVFKDTIFNTSLVKLENTGSVKGVAYSSGEMALGSALVRVKGSPFFTIADSYGVFNLESLPNGALTLQIVNNQVVTINTVIVDSAEITVVPDSVVVWDRKK